MPRATQRIQQRRDAEPSRNSVPDGTGAVEGDTVRRSSRRRKNEEEEEEDSSEPEEYEEEEEEEKPLIRRAQRGGSKKGSRKTKTKNSNTGRSARKRATEESSEESDDEEYAESGGGDEEEVPAAGQQQQQQQSSRNKTVDVNDSDDEPLDNLLEKANRSSRRSAARRRSLGSAAQKDKEPKDESSLTVPAAAAAAAVETTAPDSASLEMERTDAGTTAADVEAEAATTRDIRQVKAVDTSQQRQQQQHVDSGMFEIVKVEEMAHVLGKDGSRSAPAADEGCKPSGDAAEAALSMAGDDCSVEEGRVSAAAGNEALVGTAAAAANDAHLDNTAAAAEPVAASHVSFCGGATVTTTAAAEGAAVLATKPEQEQQEAATELLDPSSATKAFGDNASPKLQLDAANVDTEENRAVELRPSSDPAAAAAAAVPSLAGKSEGGGVAKDDAQVVVELKPSSEPTASAVPSVATSEGVVIVEEVADYSEEALAVELKPSSEQAAAAVPSVVSNSEEVGIAGEVVMADSAKDSSRVAVGTLAQETHLNDATAPVSEKQIPEECAPDKAELPPTENDSGNAAVTQVEPVSINKDAKSSKEEALTLLDQAKKATKKVNLMLGNAGIDKMRLEAAGLQSFATGEKPTEGEAESPIPQVDGLPVVPASASVSASEKLEGSSVELQPKATEAKGEVEVRKSDPGVLSPPTTSTVASRLAETSDSVLQNQALEGAGAVLDNVVESLEDDMPNAQFLEGAGAKESSVRDGGSVAARNDARTDGIECARKRPGGEEIFEVAGSKRLRTDHFLSEELLKQATTGPEFRPANEVVITKTRVNLERIKVGIFSLGSRVHGSEGYEKRFADYWNALSVRLKGRSSESKLLTCRKVLDSFLKTKTLRKLHNKLILGLLQRCIEPTTPVSDLLLNVPSHLRKLARVVPKPPSNDQIIAGKDGQMLDGGGEELLSTAKCRKLVEPGYFSAYLESSPTVSEIRPRPSNLSARIPGAMVVDPYVRKVADAAGMKVSESAVWLFSVAMKEYTKTLLESTLAQIKAVEAGHVPPRPSTSIKLLEKKRSAAGKDSSIPTQAGPEEKATKCITSLDVHTLMASLPNGGARSLNGCISRTTFELSLFSSFDKSTILGGSAFEDVRKFVVSAILPSISQQTTEAESRTREVALSKSALNMAPSVGRKSSPSRGLGRGAKDLAALKVRASIAAKPNNEGPSAVAAAAATAAAKADTSSFPQKLNAALVLPGAASIAAAESTMQPPHCGAATPGTPDAPASPVEEKTAQTIAPTSSWGRGRGFGVKDLAAIKARSFTPHSEDGATVLAAAIVTAEIEKSKEANVVPTPLESSMSEGVIVAQNMAPSIGPNQATLTVPQSRVPVPLSPAIAASIVAATQGLPASAQTPSTKTTNAAAPIGITGMEVQRTVAQPGLVAQTNVGEPVAQGALPLTSAPSTAVCTMAPAVDQTATGLQPSDVQTVPAAASSTSQPMAPQTVTAVSADQTTSETPMDPHTSAAASSALTPSETPMAPQTIPPSLDQTSSEILISTQPLPDGVAPSAIPAPLTVPAYETVTAEPAATSAAQSKPFKVQTTAEAPPTAEKTLEQKVETGQPADQGEATAETTTQQREQKP